MRRASISATGNGHQPPSPPPTHTHTECFSTAMKTYLEKEEESKKESFSLSVTSKKTTQKTPHIVNTSAVNMAATFILKWRLDSKTPPCDQNRQTSVRTRMTWRIWAGVSRANTLLLSYFVTAVNIFPNILAPAVHNAAACVANLCPHSYPPPHPYPPTPRCALWSETAEPTCRGGCERECAPSSDMLMRM